MRLQIDRIFMAAISFELVLRFLSGKIQLKTFKINTLAHKFEFGDFSTQS